MYIHWKHKLPPHFSPQSRVWVYQSSHPFSANAHAQIEQLLTHFVSTWQSHGRPVSGYASIFFNQFIVLLANEDATQVSGCSTDSSVRLIKEIATRFQVDLFNRHQLAFLINEQVQLTSLSQFKIEMASQKLSAHTLYFNNTVTTKTQLLTNWIIPLGQSWLASKIPTPILATPNK